jgi:hypothetical protein
MTAHKFRLIHCNECGVTSPREPTELERASGRICLVCGALFEREHEVDDPPATALTRT